MNLRCIHLFFFAVLAAGCSTVPPFPDRSASAEISTGQFQYVVEGRSVVGEFVLSRQGGDVQLELTKGGVVPLIKLARRGAYGWAEGPLARGRWYGVAEKAPARLRGWLVEVPRVIAASGGNSRRSRIEAAGSQPGEKFVFIFAR